MTSGFALMECFDHCFIDKTSSLQGRKYWIISPSGFFLYLRSCKVSSLTKIIDE